MKRYICCGFVGIFLACSTSEPPSAPKPTAVKPTPVDAAPTATTDAGRGDARLGMMERHAIWKAKKEADEKLAKELAEAENKRLLKFDKSKLSKHLALIAFEKKIREELEATAEKVKGQAEAAKIVEKLVNKQRKAIEAQAKNLQKIDPTGANSNIGTDHDVTLNILANDFPSAIIDYAAGDDKTIAQVRAELDRRMKKMALWLEEVRAFKK
jgi:hypothetical protein